MEKHPPKFKISFAAENTSEIRITDNSFDDLRKHLREKHKDARVAVIGDGNVVQLYRDQIQNRLSEARLLVVEPGEESKNMAMAQHLCQDLISANHSRGSVIVGLGGGMVTDLAGFVSSIYMRGVPYVAVPTSLLAMVDAAVGGKTGVNLGAKNSVGTFYPAELVLADSKFLETLPEREIRTGLAEAIKYAAILDASMEKDLMADKLDFEPILRKSIGAKVRVCNEDLHEGGLRKVLNFGHTFGHAIEYLSNYELTHGEAIGVGMVLANRIAQNLGKQSKSHGDRIREMLEKHGLPTEIPKGMTVEDMIDMVYKDKKMDGQKVTFILSPEMGKHEMVKLSPEELKKLLG